MNNQSELEALVQSLAVNIGNYPESSKEEILELATELDSKLVYGQKQRYKNRLLELLEFDVKDYEVTGSLQTISENVTYLTDLGVEDVWEVVTKFPAVLSYSIENTMKPKVEYLKSIGVKEEDIGRVVSRHPQVLEYSIENTMKPKVEYLKSIGVKEEGIGKVVSRLPAVLSYSIENTMKKRVEYLKSIGVKEEDIGKVVTRFPQVLEYSIEDTMKPKVEYLMSIGVKEEDIGRVVSRLPQVLSYSIENNLKPTCRFLSENFNLGVEDIVKKPAFLSYSLEKRIKPRYYFLKSKGLENRYKCNSILIPSDKKFCKLLKVSIEEYEEFKRNYFEGKGIEN